MSLSKQLLEAQNSAEEHSLLESVRHESALLRKERDAVKRDTESELNKSFEELKRCGMSDAVWWVCLDCN